MKCSSPSPPDDAIESGTTNPIETHPSCSWKNCPNKHRRVPLQSCARCKSVYFCGRSCQKKAWGAHHRHRCFPIDTPRRTVSEFTVEAIQSAIDRAGAGGVIVLEKGTYEGNKPLLVTECVTLLGAGKELTKLDCEGLIINKSKATSETEGNRSITVADFEVTNSSKIENNDNSTSVNVCNVRFSCPIGDPNDAVQVASKEGSISLTDCDIIGGSDGISIFGHGVHLKHTTIRHAQHRGIFSRYRFVIEDSSISHCGGYGIKGTAGWSEKGKNRIQSGPWMVATIVRLDYNLSL